VNSCWRNVELPEVFAGFVRTTLSAPVMPGPVTSTLGSSRYVSPSIGVNGQVELAGTRWSTQLPHGRLGSGAANFAFAATAGPVYW